MFHFKEFSIQQSQSAMKVGTDGVLLGAWTPTHQEKNILDIGTGTGLIALMLAQRNLVAHVDAVEIDKNAYHEACLNFTRSKWKERIQAYYTSLISFQISKKYDLIVSNPPYYTDTFKEEKSERTLARHVDALTFKALLKSTKNLMAECGKCSFILPAKEECNFLEIAKHIGLFPLKITRVRGNNNKPIKRSLLLLSQQQSICDVDELVIEIDRHVYTKEYIALTQSFYLKM